MPVSKEDLLTPKVLDLLKKLPEEDYLHLWSSTTRYKLAEEALTLSVARDHNDPAEQSSISPGTQGVKI